MNTDELIFESAEAAASMVGTEYFAKLTRYAIDLTGSELVKHLDGTEAPGLLVALDVEIDGKGRTGCALALEEFVVLGWSIGTFRTKSHSAAIQKASIRSVARTTEDGGRMMKPRQVLTIEADRTWRLLMHWMDHDGGKDITPFLQGVIEGSIRPVFADEPGQELPTNQ